MVVGRLGGGDGAQIVVYKLASVPGSAGSHQADSSSQQVDVLCFGQPCIYCCPYTHGAGGRVWYTSIVYPKLFCSSLVLWCCLLFAFSTVVAMDG